jgi:predicted AlkP superfamily pyrophosphatase or phosphodiesterase
MISFDAVGDREFDEMMKRPNFRALAAKSAVQRGVDSVFPTNTYPVHTSVSTGLPPSGHGVTHNTDPFPERHPKWRYEEANIRVTTLWQAAHRHGLSVAAVLWPVTAGSKAIRWHIPELPLRPGENQIMMNLKYGSKGFQLDMLRRHGKLLRGSSQPALDSFAAACMADTLREKKPDFALVHLTAHDTLCHIHGRGSPEMEIAFDSLDRSLGLLLNAAGDMDVILFSDHAQLNVHGQITPNDILISMGLLDRDETGEIVGTADFSSFFECCAGCAFFHPGEVEDELEVEEIKRKVAELPGFGRFLRRDEMESSGHGKLPFGFAAAPGFITDAYPSKEKANHGYPLDTPDYKVFYLSRRKGRQPSTGEGGSLLDITQMAAEVLGVRM